MALPGNNIDFLMSEINQVIDLTHPSNDISKWFIFQSDTFSSFEQMTARLQDEFLQQLRHYSALPTRISFVGHSLGCILIRSLLAEPMVDHLADRFHTYLGLSGPHLGTLYNNSGLVNMGTKQVLFNEIVRQSFRFTLARLVFHIFI